MKVVHSSNLSPVKGWSFDSVRTSRHTFFKRLSVTFRMLLSLIEMSHPFLQDHA